MPLAQYLGTTLLTTRLPACSTVGCREKSQIHVNRGCYHYPMILPCYRSCRDQECPDPDPGQGNIRARCPVQRPYLADYRSPAFDHRYADRILVMKNGSIVEERAHSELLQRDDVYARLYKAQSRHHAARHEVKTHSCCRLPPAGSMVLASLAGI